MILETSAIVLAGGESKRFHSNKALADWHGEPLLSHIVRNLKSLFSEILVVSKTPKLYPFVQSLGARLVTDYFSSHHALGGLYSGLVETQKPYSFLCACDMPLIQPELIRLISQFKKNYKAVVPVWQGFPEPLCAFYSKECLKTLEKSLKEKRYELQNFLCEIPAYFLSEEKIRIADPDGLSFKDIDTPSDYATLSPFSSKKPHPRSSPPTRLMQNPG